MSNQAESQSLYDVLAQTAARTPDAPCLAYKGKFFSYHAVLQHVDKLAHALTAAGIESDEIVAVSLPNLPKTAYILYAASKIGAVVYLQHARNTPDETMRGLKKTNSRFLFALDSACAALDAPCTQAGITLISCCPADELGGVMKFLYRRKMGIKTPAKMGVSAQDFNEFLRAPLILDKVFNSRYSRVDGGDFDALFDGKQDFNGVCDKRKIAVLLDSGGTSGVPKTVALSADAINDIAFASTHIFEENSYTNRYLMSPLPLFHCFGLMMGLHAMVALGGCNVLMPRFSRKETAFYLKRDKISFMIGVPAIYDALNASERVTGRMLKGVRSAFVGGDDLLAATKTAFDAKMEAAGSRARLFQGYGLSETLSVACVNVGSCHKDGSLGRPLKGVTVRAFDTTEAKAFLDGKDFGDAVPHGAMVGELCIAGKILMNGYFCDEDATQNTFFVDTDGVKYLKTGDLGYVDKDGFVFFLDRMKNVIKVSGETIFPSEVESIALGVDGVRAAAAFGVADTRTGSRVRLAVEPEDGCCRDALLQALHARLNALLHKNALPQAIDFYDALPRTKLLKVDLTALQKMANQE